MCDFLAGVKCSDCPFVTCNNHPDFYLALQQALKKPPRAAKKKKRNR